MSTTALAASPPAPVAEQIDVHKSHQEVMARIIRANGGEPDNGDQHSQLRSREEEAFNDYGAIPCPFPPELLVRTFERSSALRPCVEAIAANVHGYSHRLVPTIDLKDAKSDDLIAEAILSERLYAGDEDPPYPTPQEVIQRRAEIERGMLLERLRLTTFFKNCAPDGFTELRMHVGTDYEVCGNGYMEVLRSRDGRISQLIYAPATNIRLRRLGLPVLVKQREKVSDIAFADADKWAQYRSFVQVVNGIYSYFKQFGDPRIMGVRSGKYYNSIAEMPPGEQVATELLHFRVFSSRSSYGVPRWVGATFEVLGIRAAAEVNYTFFDSKGVPPLAVLVSGGTLSDGAAEMIAQFIETKIKGRQNFHSVLVLEALPAAGADPAAAGRVRIALQPLAQQQDGIFLAYVDQSEDVVARQFRLSPITRGKTSDYTRATADASLRKDEQQVFQPQRQSFDERLERTVLTDMGIRYWRVVSNSPSASDPEVLAKIVDTFVRNSTLTPEEGRRLLADVLNTEFKSIDAAWAKQPIAMTLAGIPLEDEELADPTTVPAGKTLPRDYPALFRQIVTLRDTLRAQTRKEHATAEDLARKADAAGDDDYEVIHVDPALMTRWVKPHPTPAAAP